jgi:uncharacterized membrane protein YfcA
MGAGSILGALLGGVLVPYAPQALLKIGLGIILNVSAWRIFRHRQQDALPEVSPSMSVPSTPRPPRAG